jgi:predicted permease
LNYLDWKREARSFDSMALYAATNFIVSGFGDAELVSGGIVTPDFFRVFKATPTMGREFTAEEDLPNGRNVVIVSHSFWKDRLGGRSNVIGSTISLSAGPADIVGVAPAGFNFPNHADLWTPIKNNDQKCGRGCVYVDGIARLARGVRVDQARSEMQTIASQLEKAYPATNTNTTVEVLGLQDETVQDVRTALLFILGSVVMVLLIACANVANLLLVRGAARHRELAVRAALGGGRRTLILHLLTENLILALTGGMAGLVFAWWGIGALKRIAPRNIPRLSEVAFDGSTFVFAAVIVVFTIVVFGLGPSIRLSRTSLASLLAGRGHVAVGRSARSRSVLVAAEVALSLMLLVGAGLFLRSLSGLQAVDLGFRTEKTTIFAINLPALRYPAPVDIFRTFDQLEEEFATIPGVDLVSRISGLPLSSSENVQNFVRQDKPAPAPGKVPFALYRVVDSNYFRTMGIPLVSGRDFTPADRNGPAGVIISKKMSEQYWPGEDPVGRQLQIVGATQSPLTIVGIVATVHSQELSSESQPEMYLMQAPVRTMTFVVRAAVPSAQVLASVRQSVRKADPNLPVIRPGTMQALVDQQMARTQFCLLLASLFAILAVVLASVGTYGVVAYAVVQRTREIGLRLALGAPPVKLIATMMWEGFRPAILGLALGLLGASAVTRTIRSLLFHVRPTDPSTFVAVALALSALALIATAIPASRATRVSPASTLKGE